MSLRDESADQIRQAVASISADLRTIQRQGGQGQLTPGPRFHLGGQFRGFDAERQSLQVRIHNDTYHYPLTQYDGAWLPFPNTSVLIFSEDTTEGMRPLLVAIDRGGRRIPPAPLIAMTVKALHPVQGLVTVHHPDWGMVRLNAPAGMLTAHSPKLGGLLHCRVVEALPHYYFVPMDLHPMGYDRIELLRMTR